MGRVDYKKDIWYGSTQLDDKLSKICNISGEVKNFIQNIMETIRVELTAGGKKFSRGENLVRDLPGKCNITIIICNNDDAVKSHI